MLKFPNANFLIRVTGSALCCLMAVMASAGETNSVVDSATQVKTATLESNQSVLAVPGAGIELTSHSECFVPPPACAQPVADCAQPVQCESGCKHCHQGPFARWHQYKKICHLHSTCDLYPHFAYFPEHHGYYYFRPYNYITVLEHQAIAGQLGMDPANPYSVTLLNPILDQFAEKYPDRADSFELVLPQRSSLPLLEDMLDKK